MSTQSIASADGTARLSADDAAMDSPSAAPLIPGNVAAATTAAAPCSSEHTRSRPRHSGRRWWRNEDGTFDAKKTITIPPVPADPDDLPELLKGFAAVPPLVTDIDLRTEKAITNEIKIRFPEHGVSGEEYGAVGPQDSWSWIIDPIDGTRSFISGMPTWGTLIGLLFEGKPVYGMMSQPYVGDCFIGGAGISELYNAEGSKVLKSGHNSDLANSILFSTTPDMFQAGAESDCFNHLVKKVKMTRFGADCYGYCLLASGFVDLVVESNLKYCDCLLYTSPSPRDLSTSRMPSSA